MSDASAAAAACPLCGGANACAMAGPGAAASAAPCWCVAADFSPELLARIPVARRGQACVCAACVAAQQRSPAVAS